MFIFHKATSSLVASSFLLTLSAWSAFAQAVSAPVTPEQKKPAWETTAALGLTLTRGNSDTLLFTGNVLGTKKSVVDEWALGADATYGENSNIKNTESLHGFAQYNRLINQRWYGYGRVDGLHDAIADIEYRGTFSVGIGYYFIKSAQRARENLGIG
jgi:putative salt-induced outer membrane protein YdiY